MGERDERDVDPGHAADLRREHPSGIDDQVGLDASLVCDDPVHAALPHLDARDAGVFADLRTATAGAFDQGEGELARIDVSVGREVGGAQDALGRHRREHAVRLIARNQLQWQAERLGPCGLARELLHALRARCQTKRADLVPTRLQADLFLQRSVEVDRVHHHSRQAE